jgi:energy-coupling factor transport system ATP-binding protein
MNILIEDLSFTYDTGVTALRDINFDLAGGESLAIIGENGAGKTTLAKLLNGLLKPSRGKVTVADLDTTKHTPAQLAHQIGYAFQNPDQQIFASKVIDEVSFGPRNLGYTEEQIQLFSQNALEAVGLENEGEKHPYDLHLADRKLLTLAAVLAMGTPIIVFDEPTTGQDSLHIQKIGSIIAGLKGENRTVITISHDLDFCARYFERVIVLRGGELIADGPAAEVLTQTDLLASAAVNPPQLVRLAQALDMPIMARTPEEFVQAYQNKSS